MNIDYQTQFILNDGEREFTITLETLLNCLQIAEVEHRITPLPDDWKKAVIPLHNRITCRDGDAYV